MKHNLSRRRLRKRWMMSATVAMLVLAAAGSGALRIQESRYRNAVELFRNWQATFTAEGGDPLHLTVEGGRVRGMVLPDQRVQGWLSGVRFLQPDLDRKYTPGGQIATAEIWLEWESADTRLNARILWVCGEHIPREPDSTYALNRHNHYLVLAGVLMEGGGRQELRMRAEGAEKRVRFVSEPWRSPFLRNLNAPNDRPGLPLIRHEPLIFP